jgi:DNA-binding NarL/FixJ family response regulator
MGNTAHAWNVISQGEASHHREQPFWPFYAYVSVASPHAELADAEEQVSALVGSAFGDGRPSSRSVATPSLGFGPAKPDDKQWGPWSLTQRELEVLQLLTEGATNSDISTRLFISQKTTKNHLAAIFQKLDVSNRTQALVRAVVMGLVTIE